MPIKTQAEERGASGEGGPQWLQRNVAAGFGAANGGCDVSSGAGVAWSMR